MYMMIKESITLQGSYQYFNITCYSCNSKEHIAIECPKVHYSINRKKVVSSYLINQRFFCRTYQRKERCKFSALGNLETLQEAALQHQISQQNELYFDENDEEELIEVRSYSSIDEILDKNIYDCQPLIYCADSTQFKAYAVHEDETSVGTLQNPSSPSLSHLSKKRKKKRKVENDRLMKPEGEIENFVRLNFDKYYHNLNLDRVTNFEVYNPVNNVNRLVLELDRSRILRGVEERLSRKSKHISKYLIKGFKLQENRTPKTFQSTDNLVMEKRKDVSERRKSVMPGDILMYSTKLREQFSKKGDDSSRIGYYDSEANMRKLSNDTKKSNSKKPKKSKLAATAILPGSAASRDLMIHTRKRGESALTKSKQVDSDSSDSSDSQPSSATHSSSGSETDGQPVTPKLNIQLSLDPTPNNKSSPGEKLLTANFGGSSKNAFKSPTSVGSNSNFTPRLQSRGRLPMSPSSYQEIRRKSILASEQYIGGPDYGENDSKKPIAMFDFSRMLQKMSTKLEENSRSYRRTTPTSGSHRNPQQTLSNTLTNKMSTVVPKQSMKEKEDLLVKLVHQKNKNSGFGVRKNRRASSVEVGREVRKVIDAYGLEEILQEK